MSKSTHPIYKELAFFIDEEYAPYFVLKDEQDSGKSLPESVQAILDTEWLHRAVHGAINLKGFKKRNPGYDHLTELIPKYYRDLRLVYEILSKKMSNVVFYHKASVEIETYESGKMTYPVQTSIQNKPVLYLVPNKRPGYFHAPYASIDELVDEYKKQMTGYLNKNFDFRRHICTINGTYVR